MFHLSATCWEYCFRNDMLLYIWCRHDASAKELADRPKFVSTPHERILEHVMSIRRILLSFSESADVVVPRSTLRALGLMSARLIEAALVKGMLAEEMHSGEIQGSAACGTSS